MASATPPSQPLAAAERFVRSQRAEEEHIERHLDAISRRLAALEQRLDRQ